MPELGDRCASEKSILLDVKKLVDVSLLGWIYTSGLEWPNPRGKDQIRYVNMWAGEKRTNLDIVRLAFFIRGNKSDMNHKLVSVV